MAILTEPETERKGQRPSVFVCSVEDRVFDQVGVACVDGCVALAKALGTDRMLIGALSAGGLAIVMVIRLRDCHGARPKRRDRNEQECGRLTWQRVGGHDGGMSNPRSDEDAVRSPLGRLWLKPMPVRF